MTWELVFDLSFLILFVVVVTIAGFYAEERLFGEEPVASAAPVRSAASSQLRPVSSPREMAPRRRGEERHRRIGPYRLKSCPRCGGDLIRDREEEKRHIPAYSAAGAGNRASPEVWHEGRSGGRRNLPDPR